MKNLKTYLYNNLRSGLAVPVVFGFSRVYYSTDKGDKLDRVNFVKLYLDADKQKLDILKENEGKSGIYLWKNKDGKFYIGSSVNIRRRLITYYNLEHLAKYPKRYINNALLKYGYSAFSLYILEYCNEEDLIKREQYYFELLEPNYNICTVAGSTLGRLHRAESKGKISDTKIGTNLEEANHFFGQTHTEEARKKMSDAKLNRTLTDEIKKKISNSMAGRTFSEERKLNLSLSKRNSKKLTVLNLQTNEETIYNSISQAERSLGFPKGSIRDNLKSKSGLPYRGIYKFTSQS